MDKLSLQLIKLAYQEDIGAGDITTEMTVAKSKRGKAVVIAKSEGILSGSGAFRYAFKLASSRIMVVFHIRDGNKFKTGKRIVTIEGSSQGLMKGERLALNLLSHLSGVAAFTNKFVERIKDTKTKVLDTRKTTPGLRNLEKKAVVDGGGQNHRYGLYDMILIKDNHITAAGGVDKALQKVQKTKRKVEIEVADFKQLETALNYAPDIIMLDNFNVQQLKKAVVIIKSVKPKIKIEVSGGITLRNIRSRALAGVDYISIGALTHSAPAADFSMRYVK